MYAHPAHLVRDAIHRSRSVTRLSLTLLLMLRLLSSGWVGRCPIFGRVLLLLTVLALLFRLLAVVCLPSRRMLVCLVRRAHTGCARLGRLSLRSRRRQAGCTGRYAIDTGSRVVLLLGVERLPGRWLGRVERWGLRRVGLRELGLLVVRGALL